MKGGFQYGNMDKEISENVNTDTCHLSRYRLHGILKCTGSHQKVRYNLLPYLHKWQKRQNNNKLWQKILYVRHKKSCVQGKHSDDAILNIHIFKLLDYCTLRKLRRPLSTKKLYTKKQYTLRIVKYYLK